MGVVLRRLRAVWTPSHPRIVLDPAILDGKPIVRGTRLSVEHLIGLMAEGWCQAEILADYPGLAQRGPDRVPRLRA